MPTREGSHEEWDAWIAQACTQLHIEPELADVDLVHELSKNVAHHVLRPMAPVSTYLLGIALGRALERGEPTDAAARRELARLIPQSETPAGSS